MRKDYTFGRTSYLPRIQYNQLVSNQKYNPTNQGKVNFLELSLNHRNTFSPHNHYNIIILLYKVIIIIMT